MSSRNTRNWIFTLSTQASNWAIGHSLGTAPSVTLPSPWLTCSPRKPAPAKLGSQIPYLFLSSWTLWPREINSIALFIELNVLLLHCATALRVYFFLNYIHSIFRVVLWFGNWKTDGLQNWEGAVVAMIVETRKFGEIMLKLRNYTENFSFWCAVQCLWSPW